MGALTILMATLLLAGIATGVALAVTGSLPPATAIWPVAATAGLWLCFRAIEPAARMAHGFHLAGAPVLGRLMAALYGAVPASIIVAYQIVTHRVPDLGGAAPAIVLVALMTVPATVLALRAGRQRRTLWSARAYGAHLSGWVMLAGAGLALPLGVTAAFMLLCHTIPVVIGYLEGVTDPAVLRSVRM